MATKCAKYPAGPPWRRSRARRAGRYRLKKEPRAKPRGPTRAVRRKTKPLKQEAGKTPHDPRKDDVSIISEEVRVALPGNPTAQELELEAQRLAKDWVDPTGTKNARERTLSLIVRRQGQPAFRRQLIAAYKGRCAITGCEVQAVLEAAHIVPYKGSKTNDPGNGLLLRADMHTLFDLRLVAVDVATMHFWYLPHSRAPLTTIIVESGSWLPTIQQASAVVPHSNNIDRKAALFTEAKRKKRRVALACQCVFSLVLAAGHCRRRLPSTRRRARNLPAGGKIAAVPARESLARCQRTPVLAPAALAIRGRKNRCEKHGQGRGAEWLQVPPAGSAEPRP